MDGRHRKIHRPQGGQYLHWFPAPPHLIRAFDLEGCLGTPVREPAYAEGSYGPNHIRSHGEHGGREAGLYCPGASRQVVGMGPHTAAMSSKELLPRWNG